MKICTYITHPDVPDWNLDERHKAIIQKETGVENIILCSTKEQFLEELKDSRIALIWNFEQEWLSRAPELEWIVTPAAGKDYFSLDPPEGVELTYGSFHGEIMGETALAMMLAEARGLRKAIQLTPPNPWPRDEIWKTMSPLRNSRVTILGFGNIGSWIGKLAKPFGVKITGIKRTPADPPEWFDREDKLLTMENWKEVLPETDHLVLVLPSGEETTDIIGEEELKLLPAHSVIYNLGRGNAINEEALLKALEKGQIQAAYLDVFKTEPLPGDSPLLDHPNLIIMPHASAVTPNYLELFAYEFVGKFTKKYGKSHN